MPKNTILKPVQPKPYETPAKDAGKSVVQKTKAPVVVVVDGQKFTTTAVFDTFWRYASERQSIEDKRRAGEPQP